jgi:hypothetical protein
VPPAPPGVFHHVKRGFPAKVNPNEKILNLRKSNVAQSPLKMRFLVMLVRNRWMPDAIAQMKFSPKHRAVEVGKMLRVSYIFVRLILLFISFFFLMLFRELVLSPKPNGMSFPKNYTSKKSLSPKERVRRKFDSWEEEEWG